MKFAMTVSALAVAASTFAFAGVAEARDNIQIAGSSTVLPFASIVAEEFGQAFPDFKTPVVGSGGSGGGLKQFCEGVGENTIDIADASRPIKSKEVATCNANGVKDILEIRIGYDGIVFASSVDKSSFALKPEFVFKAIAAKLPDGENKYTKWSQIDPSLPDQEIQLVIPASNHGTREVFEEKVVDAGCKAVPEFAKLEGDEEKAACLSFRQDGRVVEISGDYTETLARLDAQKDAVGVFGLSFYEENKDKLQVATMDGVTPTQETVAKGEYPVSRPLFFYVKGEHIGLIPGIEEYTHFFLSPEISGDGSPLVNAGLIPLGDAEREEVLANFDNRKAVMN